MSLDAHGRGPSGVPVHADSNRTAQVPDVQHANAVGISLGNVQVRAAGSPGIVLSLLTAAAVKTGSTEEATVAVFKYHWSGDGGGGGGLRWPYRL